MRLLGVDGPVLQVERVLGEPRDVEHRARHDAMAHARQQHAGVVALDDAEGFGALADLVGESVQVRLALGRWQRAPRRKGILRRLDRGFDMLGRAFGNTTEQPLVDRTEQLQRLRRSDPPSADVVVGRDGDAGDTEGG